MIGTPNKALPTSAPIRRPIFFILAILSVALLLTLYLPAAHAAPRTSPLVTLPDTVSTRLAGAKMIGHHSTSDQMTIGLLLQLNNQAELQNLITSLYAPHSALYHQWLQPGDFTARFGPSSSQIVATQNFLTQAGLQETRQKAPSLESGDEWLLIW
jgi:subtilase family serine protease